MKNQDFEKGFSILAVVEIVILIAVLAISGFMAYNYFYSTQNKEQVISYQANQNKTPVDETADWQTYSNYDYGFQTKHPADWSVNILPEVKDRINFIAPAPQTKIFDFEIRVQANPEKLSAKDFVQQMLQKNTLEDIGRISYKTSQELTISGFSAYELNEVFVYDQNQEWIYVATNDYIYRFSFPIAEENPNLQDPINNNKISHLMLSTFIFMGGTATKEESCIVSGGKVSTITCYCSSSVDFYNNCIVGGCACTPDPKYAKQVKNCECPAGKCFNGIQCINQLE
ncbi:MAG: hypothetical protein AAB529_00590 [Patescibacteria group bacterium]